MRQRQQFTLPRGNKLIHGVATCVCLVLFLGKEWCNKTSKEHTGRVSALRRQRDKHADPARANVFELFITVEPSKLHNQIRLF